MSKIVRFEDIQAWKKARILISKRSIPKEVG